MSSPEPEARDRSPVEEDDRLDDAKPADPSLSPRPRSASPMNGKSPDSRERSPVRADSRDRDRSPQNGRARSLTPVRKADRSLSRSKSRDRRDDRARSDSRDRDRRRRTRSRSRSRPRYRSRSRDRDRSQARDRSRDRDRHRRGSPLRRGYSPPRRGSPRRRSPAAFAPYYARPRRTPPRFGTTLFVAGLNFITNEREVERKFERYGRVREARIVRNPANGESRGFGFVAMEREDDVDQAIRHLDGAEWNGRRLAVERARNVK